MKNIIVSGCARGIGEAVAKKLLKEGYSVTGMSRTSPKKYMKNSRMRISNT